MKILLEKKTKTWWTIFSMFSVIIMPELFTQIKVLSLLFAGLEIMIWCYFLIINIREKIFSIYNVVWIIICGYQLMLMLFNGNVHDIDKWGRLLILVSSVIMIIKYYTDRGKTKELLSAITSLGILYFLINSCSALVFSSGILHTFWGNYYFLGLRTDFLKFFFPFFTVAGLYFIYYKQKLQLIILSLLALFSFIYFQISTAVTCVVVFLGLFLFHRKLENIISMKVILASTTALNVAFVTMNAAKWFSWFITFFLKKDLMLNSRMLIWEDALSRIMDTKIGLIIGHGIVNDGKFVMLYNLYWPAHNQLLQWIFEYGIIGTVAIYVFFLMLDEKNKNESRKDIFFVRAVLFTMFVSCISSSPFNNYLGYISVCFLPFLNNMSNDEE